MIDEEKIIRTIKKDYTSFKKLPPQYYTRNILLEYFDALLFRAETSHKFMIHVLHNLDLYRIYLEKQDVSNIISRIDLNSITSQSLMLVESKDLRIEIENALFENEMTK